MNRHPCESEPKRQAVVLIHGIGEQRPMEALQGFVKAVWEKENATLSIHDNSRRTVWSKPDFTSGSFELRRLTTDYDKHCTRTDFFEFYWAHLMEGTRLRHVLSWAKRLLWRSPSQVPRPLTAAYWLLWFFIIGLLSVLVAGLFRDQIAAKFDITIPSVLIASITGIGVVLLQSFFYEKLLRQIVGDAARYLSPSPPNVKVRQEIRKAGIKLIKRLNRKEKYDRIIIVGHSLGSVIGYDILTHLWPRYNNRFHPDKESNNELLNEMGRISRKMQILVDKLEGKYDFSKYDFSGYGLKLLPDANVNDLPLKGESQLIVVAKIGEFHHIRIFNETEKIIFSEGGDEFLGDKCLEDESSPYAALVREINAALAQKIDAALHGRSVDAKTKENLIQKIKLTLHTPGDSKYKLERFLWGRPFWPVPDEESQLKEESQLAKLAKDYRDKQSKYFDALQTEEKPWRISDFITLGCPLTHADLLLAENIGNLRERQDRREYPTCPPFLEEFAGEWRFSYPPPSSLPHDQDPNAEQRRLPHFASVFAPVRWTNLYFPSKFILWGDVIGGPLGAPFGYGVKDIEIKADSGFGFLSHTKYWSLPDERKSLDESNDSPSHIEHLRKIFIFSRNKPTSPSNDHQGLE
ncbi:MAG: hypothetical protein AAGC88_06360 [Bacteroidota bacterium]